MEAVGMTIEAVDMDDVVEGEMAATAVATTTSPHQTMQDLEYRRSIATSVILSSSNPRRASGTAEANAATTNVHQPCEAVYQLEHMLLIRF